MTAPPCGPDPHGASLAAPEAPEASAVVALSGRLGATVALGSAVVRWDRFASGGVRWDCEVHGRSKSGVHCHHACEAAAAVAERILGLVATPVMPGGLEGRES